jgi:DNA polymerase-4
MGERFWHGLHGYETIEEPTKKSMIGHSRVLTREHETPDKARIVARALLLKAASRLRHYGMHASSLSLSVRLRPEGGWQAARRFSYSQDSFQFLALLDDMWADFSDAQRRKGHFPRLGGVTVYLHGLAKQGETALEQLDLFAEPKGVEKNARRAGLWKAIDTINADLDAKFQRLGGPRGEGGPKRHVALASQSGLALNYLGAKIAFSRVPEEAEFLF